jgi:hypothetical protein
VLPALMGADGRRWMWRPVLGASVLFGLFTCFRPCTRADAMSWLGTACSVLPGPSSVRRR